METDNSNPASKRILHFIVFPLGALIVLTALFYAVEDWRGLRAWKQYKADSAAHGVPLNWARIVPPAVPDDQNFFKQPNMQAWFVGRGGNALSARLAFSTYGQFAKEKENHPIARVTLVPFDAHVAAGDADLVLHYDYTSLTIANSENPPPSADMNVITIALDHVPLDQAIRNLARQAGLNYQIDPAIANLKPEITFHWTNLTGKDALVQMLHEQKLTMSPVGSGVFKIAKMKPGASFAHVEPAITSAIAKLIVDADNSATSGKARKHLTGSSGLEIVSRAPSHVRPVQIVVRTDRTPGIEEIKDFFPDNPFGSAPASRGVSLSQLDVENDGTGFNVYFYPPPQIAAEDYIAWSDQFAEDFTNINAALDLPYARMDGDYDDAGKFPIPNFVCLRTLAQTLGQRAQAHLLLNKPQEALRDLTLLHHVSRIMESRPTGEPMTLVAAMINVAIRGLYISAVADGIRLQVWREPELAALQQQLAEVDLLPRVRDAFAFEIEIHSHMVETRTSHQMAKSFSSASSKKLADKLKDSTYMFITLAPHGWLYQNFLRMGRLQAGNLDDFDPTNHLIFPNKTDRHIHEIEKSLRHLTVYTLLGAQMIPNYSRAIQIAAKNQTLANEAQTVCALERFHLARGYYPATLDALIPNYATQFPADIIGGAPLKYRVKDGQFTLYSIGWNEQDDGGKPAWNETAEGDATKNDWVWPYQAK